MDILHTLLVIVQVLSALAVIILVLLQQGKGADMGAAFGGGASGSLFGATGSANFLSRTTAICATLFFLCTLGLAMTSQPVKKDGAGVMEGVSPTAPAAQSAPDTSKPAAPASPVQDIPK